MASAEATDPNELVLQSLKSGNGGDFVSNINLGDSLRNDVPTKVVPVTKKTTPIARSIIDDPIKRVTRKKVVKKKLAKKQVFEEPALEIPAADDAFNPNGIEPAAGSKAVTWFSTLSNGQRMTLTFAKRPRFTYDEKNGEMTFRFSGAASYNPPLIPKKFKDSFEKIEKLSGSNLAVKVKFKKGAKFAVTSNSRRVFFDVISDEVVTAAKEEPKKEEAVEAKEAEPEVKEVTAEAVKKVAAAEKIEAPKEAEPKLEQVKYINYDKNIITEKDGDIESYTFKFEEKTDAAMFERFGEYWLVFHTNEPVGLPNIEKSDIFSNVEILPNKKAVVYKFALKKNAYASTFRDRNTWKIEFNPILESPLKFPLALKKDGEEWYVNVPGIDFSVDIKDDFTDEVLTVFPSRNASEGFKNRVIYSDFIVEESILGIVLRKISDGSKVTFSKNQLRLTPSIAPRNLFAGEEGEGILAEGKDSYLIDFDKMKRLEKTFSGDDGRKMMHAISKDLRGQTLFAQRFYREAATDLGGRVGFENSFLSAAAYFLSGRFDKAAADLERIKIPQGKDYNEYLLWLIASKEGYLKEDPRAKVSIVIPDNFALPANLKNYPVDVATALQTGIVEAAIDTDKTELAELVINNISKKSKQRDLDYVEYLRGKLYAMQGKKERAIALWTILLNETESREVRARATYDKVVTALETGKISDEQAIAELDSVRIIWRGDALEFDILTKSAELYAKTGKYPEALMAYKTAVTAIPFHPNSDEITKKMRSIYKTAMQLNYDDPIKSFDALTLYYDYSELKPTGREGEYMTIELAERLVGLDLIEQGIEVLEEFVTNVKDIEEKSLINTRIAILYYMLREPEKALARLEASENDEAPSYIQLQRKILFVRILAKEGKYDEALAKINRIPMKKAQELRAEIYWFKQDWQKFIENYVGMDDDDEVNIMKAAIAYSMLGDNAALGKFNSEKTDVMSKGRYAKAFSFITQENLVDYEHLASSLDLNFAKDVVDNYKSNLRLTDNFDKDVASVAN